MNCVASNPANKANKYYVNSLQGVEEERAQEQQSQSWTPGTATDITPEDVERLGGPDAAPISTSEIERMNPTDQA
eukprot:9278724-Lingulodinium_polyedra.AAC.1